MSLVLRIGARNLWRQKRRNLLLGAAIALGVMILVLANAFANGITDILLNKIVVRVAGHISVAFNERGSLYRMIFRDRERILATIRGSVEGIREVEESLGVFCRVIGNGRSENVVAVGIDLGQSLSPETLKEIEDSFRMIVGDFEDLGVERVENPVILSEERAAYLNVGKDDILRMRFTNIYGNDDTARATVVGIVRNDNVFMQAVMFMELARLKGLMGYAPHEVGNVNITLDDPRENAVRFADVLHGRLRPGPAVIAGEARGPAGAAEAVLLGLRSRGEALAAAEAALSIVDGPPGSLRARDPVLVSEALAARIGAVPGGRLEFGFARKFAGPGPPAALTVSAVFRPAGGGLREAVLMGERPFYDLYYANLPGPAPAQRLAGLPGAGDPLAAAIAPEWELLERTTTTDELQKKIKDISRGRWKATTVDVRTMYESASEVLKLEQVLNLITVVAVLALFAIILIGLVNTLRMAIRERTREIGTVRAIGMQKRDVRNTFLAEALLLSLLASTAGTAAAFAAMRLLAIPTFEMGENPLSILLVSGHLYFKPTLAGVAGSLALIQAIVAATAFFPARRAANLAPTEALRS